MRFYLGLAVGDRVTLEKKNTDGSLAALRINLLMNRNVKKRARKTRFVEFVTDSSRTSE